MKDFFSLYQYYRWLSLDVVTGACICSLFIAKCLQVNLSVYSVLALAFTVWLVYTVDHLWDAKKVKQQASTKRHLFHQQFFQPLIYAAGMIGLLGLFLLFKLPIQTFVYGVILLLVVGGYYTMLLITGKKGGYFKEIIVAFIYSTGIFLAPLSIYEGAITTLLFFIFVHFFLLALINLFIFSWYEKETDDRDGHVSIAQFLGVEKLKNTIIVLLLTSMFLCVIAMFALPMTSALLKTEGLFMMMTAFLSLLIFKKDYFHQHDRYRILGDAVFFLPLIFML